MQTAAAGALTAVSYRSTTSCVAVGQAPSGSTLTEIWNGTTWTVQQSGAGGPWLGLSCASADACLAARAYPAAGIADGWDGTSWTALPQAPPQFNPISPFYSAVSCPAVNACTIVVNNLSIPGNVQPDSHLSPEGLAFRWDGSAWSTQQIQLPAGEYVNTIGGVSCPSVTTCTAVGSYSFLQSNSPELIAPLLERWDGTTWSTQPAPPLYESGGPALTAVSSPSTTTCTAIGENSIVIADGIAGNSGNPGCSEACANGLVYTVPVVLSYP
jgi:hypothetical protein